MTGTPMARILAITLALFIVALLPPDHSRHADAQANNAPVISTPDSTTWEYHVWQLNQEISVYEGPSANKQLAAIILGDYDSNGTTQGEQPTQVTSPTEVLQIPQTASYAGARTWTTGNRDRTTNRPWVICLDKYGTLAVTAWDTAGGEDSSLITVAPPAQTKNGHATLKFNSNPDLENRADHNTDNAYLVRFYNTHNLHNQTDVSKIPSCSGSAVDLEAKIKDVRPPAQATSLMGNFKTGDNSTIELSRTKPTGFMENGSIVAFPHTSQDVSGYTYQYRAGQTEDWTSTMTATSVELSSLDETYYQATTNEGDSELSQNNIEDLPNTPPTVLPPSPSEISFMFPFGKSATLNYNSPASTDADGDDLTYRFAIELNSIVPAEDAFLMFTPDGNNFIMEASKTVTPKEWIDTHATDNIAATVIPAYIYANDGEDDSTAGEFSIHLSYDPSAFFTDPAVHQGDNRYTISEHFTTYEGPNAGWNIGIPWDSVIKGDRNWAAGNPSTPAWCREDGDIRNLNWPADGNEDSSKINAPGTTSSKSGNLTPSFANAHDFENPTDTGADNTYDVRLHNKHNLHNPNTRKRRPTGRFSNRFSHTKNAYRITKGTTTITITQKPIPTNTPTPTPTPTHTPTPTIADTEDDGPGGTEQPTEEPPTQEPTTAPTTAPTAAPTPAPTQPPTAVPTTAPTAAPTQEPTQEPIRQTSDDEEKTTQSGDNNPTATLQPKLTTTPPPPPSPTVIILSAIQPLFPTTTPIPTLPAINNNLQVKSETPLQQQESQFPEQQSRTPSLNIPIIGNAIPRVRQIVNTIIDTPRKRITLIFMLAITLIAATTALGYLITRRR